MRNWRAFYNQSVRDYQQRLASQAIKKTIKEVRSDAQFREAYKTLSKAGHKLERAYKKDSETWHKAVGDVRDAWNEIFDNDEGFDMFISGTVQGET